jgi:hypothetical protein
MPRDDQKDPLSFQQPTEIPEPCRLPQRDLHLETPGQEYPREGNPE